MTRDPPDSARVAWGILAGALLLGGALRVWLALHDDGIFWPDEIHQTLEPAHREVFGYGTVSWDLLHGARNWALPGFLALVLRVAAACGLDHPRGYVTLVKLLFVAASLATAGGVYALARRSGAGREAAATGAAVWALGAPFIYFAPRAMSENASLALLVWGFALTLDRRAPSLTRLLGLSLVGLAVLVRLQCAVLAAALLLIVAARRERARTVEAVAVLAAWALLFGLVDRLTWGRWFQSAIAYANFNLGFARTARPWGEQSTLYFPRVLFTSLPGPSLCLALLALAAWRRARGITLAALAFIALHSAYVHKELRFVLPALPLLCAAAGAGLGALWPAVHPRLAGGVVLAVSALSAATFHHLTFDDLGLRDTGKGPLSAYDDQGPVNRLLFAAHDRADLCGIKVERARLAWTGGFSYLHRRVPLYGSDGPPRSAGRYNYVIAGRRGDTGGTIVASDGDLALVRLPVERCAPDPDYGLDD